MTRRLVSQRSTLDRALAISAHASLVEPYTREIPNLWWRRRGGRARARPAGRRRWRWAFPLLILAACGTVAPTAVAPAHLPPRLVPKNIGILAFQREPAAEANYRKAGDTSVLKEGQVYSIRHDAVVEGSLQVSLFKPDIQTTDPRVLQGIERTIGEGTFEDRTVHGQQVNVMRLPDQNIYLWFPPRSNAMSLLVIRHQFKSADTLMRAIIEYQQGRVPGIVPVPSPSIVTALPTPPPAAPGLAPVAPSPATSTPSPSPSAP